MTHGDLTASSLSPHDRKGREGNREVEGKSGPKVPSIGTEVTHEAGTMDGASRSIDRVCPVCLEFKLLRPDGRIATHNGTTMRWSGRRWFLETCRGSGRRPTTEPSSVQINVVEPAPPRPTHPCEHGHRWAWLTAGGQACGVCGRPR